MILLIDNYDSFSYNLYQYLGETIMRSISRDGFDDWPPTKEGAIHIEQGEIAEDIRVIRNDEMTVDEIGELKPDHIILSPGPGRPEDAGVIIDVVKKLGKDIPILGVCLGHQAICAAFGADIIHAKRLMHGKQSRVRLDNDCLLFKGLPPETEVARYHSLAADTATMPDELKVTAKTADGEIMAVMHREYPIYGVQFHPESIMTPDGKKMLANFLGHLE